MLCRICLAQDRKIVMNLAKNPEKVSLISILIAMITSQISEINHIKKLIKLRRRVVMSTTKLIPITLLERIGKKMMKSDLTTQENQAVREAQELGRKLSG